MSRSPLASEEPDESGEASSYDEIPVKKHVPIPSALFRMKRQPDQLAAGGKRKRIYHDANGDVVVVDEDIFRSVAHGDLGQKHAASSYGGMEEDEDDDDSSVNPFEERLDQQKLERARLERGIKATNMVEKAIQTRTVTPGVRRIARVLQSQNLTNEDLVETLDNDDECLRWAPAVSPETSLVNSILKANTNGDSCYGCSRGIGVQRVTHDKLQELRQMIIDLYPTTHVIEVCGLVSQWFELEIKEKCNAKPIKGLSLIESWSPGSIFEHIHYHMTEASFIHNKLLRDWLQHLRIVQAREVYRVPPEHAGRGAKVTMDKIRVTRRGHDMLLQSTKMVLEILSKKPEQMANYNPSFNIAQQYTGPLNHKVAASTALQLESIFDEQETGV